MQLTQNYTDDDLGATKKGSKHLIIMAINDVNKLVLHSQDNSCTIVQFYKLYIIKNSILKRRNFFILLVHFIKKFF